MNEPTMKFIKEDRDSSYPRVNINFPDNPLTINVGENFVEWGIDAAGMCGGEIELSPEGDLSIRFAGCERLLTMDAKGLRVYESDTPTDDSLLLNLPHDRGVDL